jgi:hypothetical protein
MALNDDMVDDLHTGRERLGAGPPASHLQLAMTEKELNNEQSICRCSAG